MAIPRKGKGLKGQKWNGETGVWEYPAGYVAPQNNGPTTPPVPKLEEKPISAGDVASIVNEALEKQKVELLSTMSTKIQNETPKYTGDTERHLPVDLGAIPDSDLLEKPVNYFAWNRYLYVDAYIDRGRPVNPPYNKPIVFSPMPPLIDTDDKGERKELQRCMVEIWSKAQINFIETCPWFAAGIIMKDARDLKTDDIKYVHLKTQVIAAVARMPKTELITQCRGRQITGLDNDFTKMRNMLIESMCKEINGQNKQRAEKMARESANAQLMYGK